MPCIRNGDHVEILVRLDQRLYHEQGALRRYVVVHRAVGEHEMALELRREQLIRLIVVVGLAILVLDQQPLVHLAPVVLVVAIIVVAALGPTDLEEPRITEHRVRGRIAPAGMSPDADAREVHPRIGGTELVERGDLVGQRVVAHLAVPQALECRRAVRRAHAVDGDHDEAELSQRLIVAVRGGEVECSHWADLRTWIHVIDDRIAFTGIEVGRLEEEDIEVRLVVPRFDDAELRWLPADGLQTGNIRGRHLRQRLARARIAQSGDGRLARGGAAVDEVSAVRRHAYGMFAALLRQQGGFAAIQACFPELSVIRVDTGYTADGPEPYRPALGIDVQNLGDVADTPGDGVLQLAGLEAVEVEIAPVVALAVPDCLIGAGEVTPTYRIDAAAVVRSNAFLERRAYR